jgi:predicted ribosomally synthesized peptide with nif11-like leader
MEDVYRVRTVYQFKPKENIMSLDQARLFIEKMKSDEAFAKRVMAIEDVAERINLIKCEGFNCNEVEINAVSSELSDEELDDAAGGGKRCGRLSSGENGWGPC